MSKFLRFSILLSCLVSAVLVHAAVGDTWQSEDGRLTFTSTLEHPATTSQNWTNYQCSVAPTSTDISGELDIPDRVDYDEKEWGVQMIEGAFCGCHNITRVTGTVNGKYAFAGCKGITEVSDCHVYGESAFAGCSNLVSVHDCYVSGRTAFAGVTSIEKVYNCRVIGWQAFAGCTGITELNNSDPYGTGCFSGCTSLPSTLILYPTSRSSTMITIGENAFEGCNQITEVKFVNNPSVTPDPRYGYSVYINPAAFHGLTNLRSVSISKEYLSINIYGYPSSSYGAFSGCTALESFTFDADPDDLVYMKIGERSFFGCVSLKNIDLRGVDWEVGRAAFAGCQSLEKVELTRPKKTWRLWDHTNNQWSETSFVTDSLGYIGVAAFFGCSSLKEVNIPYVSQISAQAFAGCTSLTDVKLGHGLYEVRSRAFEGCRSLRNIRFNFQKSTYRKKYEIRENAFIGCSALENVDFGENLQNIQYGAFMACTSLKSVTIPDGWEWFGSSVFSGCTSLRSVKYGKPSGSDYYNIGACAFGGCTSLEEVTLPDEITDILPLTFSGCTSLTKFVAPRKTYNINNGAFAGCSSLKEFYYYGTGNISGYPLNISCSGNSYFSGGSGESWNVKETGLTNNYTSSSGSYTSEPVFNGCTSLEAFVMPNSDWNLGCRGVSIYDNTTTYYENNADFSSVFQSCGALKTVVIPNVTSIGNKLFQGHSNLESVQLGLCTHIGENAFAGCTGLKDGSINLDNSLVQEIRSQAFAGCTGLETLSLTGYLQNVGTGAFGGCSGLKKLTINKPEILTFAAGALSGTGLLDVYSPNGLPFKLYNATVATTHGKKPRLFVNESLVDTYKNTETLDGGRVYTDIFDFGISGTESRSSGPMQWATLCMPYETTAQELGLARLATLSHVTFQNANSWRIVFEEIDLNEDANRDGEADAVTIEAGKPYLVWPGGVTADPSVTATVTEGSTETAIDNGYTVSFIGTLTATTLPYDAYFFGGASGRFLHNNQTEKTLAVGANRAYITITAPSGSAAKLQNEGALGYCYMLPTDNDGALTGDSQTTGVATVVVKTLDDTDAPVFDLSGRRMPAGAALPKGIYVRNGRKFVVR